MVALVQHVSKTVFFVLLGASIFRETTVNAATSASLGLGRYSGDSYQGNFRLVELGHENNYFSPGDAGWQSGVRLSHSADPSSETNSLSLDQGIGSGISFGVSGSKSKGVPESEDQAGFEMTRLAGRVGFWLRKSTLRIGLEGSSQKTQKQAREFQDTDGYVVRVAGDVSGSTATLRLTHLTTPTTILLGNVSQTRSLGRPQAVSYGGEVRQFISATKSAVHLGLDRYQDSADVEKTTDYGKVTGTTETLRIQQRIVPLDMILSSTSRWHQETEVPRSPDSATLDRFHMSQIFAARWRYIEGAWTDESSEVGLFGGFFQRREVARDFETTEFIRMYGLQLKLVI